MAQTREEKNAKRREKRAAARLAEENRQWDISREALLAAREALATEVVTVDDATVSDNDVIDYTLIEGRPIIMTVETAVPVARQARGRKYNGSLAQRIDNALQEGGTLAEMAEYLGVKKGVINACVKIRVASGKWKLNRDGEFLWLAAV